MPHGETELPAFAIARKSWLQDACYDCETRDLYKVTLTLLYLVPGYYSTSTWTALARDIPLQLVCDRSGPRAWHWQRTPEIQMVEKEKEKQSCNLGNVEMEDPFSFLAHPSNPKMCTRP
jgi:hypothetical protein